MSTSLWVVVTPVGLFVGAGFGALRNSTSAASMIATVTVTNPARIAPDAHSRLGRPSSSLAPLRLVQFWDLCGAISAAALAGGENTLGLQPDPQPVDRRRRAGTLRIKGPQQLGWIADHPIASTV